MEIGRDDDLVGSASKGGEITKTQNVAAQTRSLVEQSDRSPVDYEHAGYAALAIFLDTVLHRWNRSELAKLNVAVIGSMRHANS